MTASQHNGDILGSPSLVVGNKSYWVIKCKLNSQWKATSSNKLFTPSAELTHVAQRITFLSNIKHGEFSEKILYPLAMHRASDR